MIESRDDLRFYIFQDRRALGFNNSLKWKIGQKFTFRGKILKFQILLRKEEYYFNNNIKIIGLFYRFRKERLGIKLGFEIPRNTFGYGLNITHTGMRIVNKNCKVGINCRIHSGVNIGGTEEYAPQIGDNVYIGPGVKLYGDIYIADHIKIGANSVVNKSFLDSGVTIAGVPAKIVSKKKD